MASDSPNAPLRAFTLIELLIVVAIIAILAAIAVPNFLEAQVRAKVSRVKSDHRTIATALESYAVDTNRYPPEGNPTESGKGVSVCADTSLCLIRLTTPIAYLSGGEVFECPFVHQGGAYNRSLQSAISLRHYYYTNYENFLPVRDTSVSAPDWRVFRAWGLSSLGPDRTDDGILWAPTRATVPINGLYDPTNGTMSWGDIARFGGNMRSEVMNLLNTK